MNVLVVGGGSIGERHLRCFQQSGRCSPTLCEADAARCQEVAQRYGVKGLTSLDVAARVTFLGRIDDDAMLDRLARCRAVCFTPLDEDYGFVTVEAFASRKAVVTCRDSGGPT